VISNISGKKFTFRANIKQHKQKPNETSTYKCSKCESTFETIPEFTAHWNTAQHEVSTTKVLNGNSVKTEDSNPLQIQPENPSEVKLESDIEIKEEKIEEFLAPTDLNLKQRSEAGFKYSENELLTYSSMTCGKNYKSKRQVQIHVKSHSIPQEIDVEQAPEPEPKPSFTYSENQLLPYSCLACGKNYKSKRQVQIHVKSHSIPQEIDVEQAPEPEPKPSFTYSEDQLLPYSCSTCSKNYKSKRQVENHIKTHSNHTENEDCSENSAKRAIQIDCEFCDGYLLPWETPHQHLLKHKSEFKFSCNICLQKFHLEQGLRNHIRWVHLLKYRCFYCPKRFKTDLELMEHNKEHLAEVVKEEFPVEPQEEKPPVKSRKRQPAKSKETPEITTQFIADETGYSIVLENQEIVFYCSNCPANFKSLLVMKRHLRSDHPFVRKNTKQMKSRYECYICRDGEFDSLEELIKHVNWEHTDTKEKVYTCEHCNHQVHTKAAMIKHKKQHQLQCKTCLKFFTHKISLHRHRQTYHYGESRKIVKKYKCPRLECKGAFATKVQLQRHIRRHRYLYKCPHCKNPTRCFNQNCQYQKHLKTHYPPEFECKSCPRSFRSIKSLKNHIKVTHIQKQEVMEVQETNNEL
jgi:hypothetical protein